MDRSDRRVERRGLMVWLTALVAGLVAKASERVAHAADGGNMILGSPTNQANSQTLLTVPSIAGV